MSTKQILKLDNVVKKFPVGDGRYFTALKGINLEIDKGEFAGLVGPSGSGKTTLLNIIGSLDSPTEGKAIVMGQNISELTHKESAKLRNIHIGFIFQVYNLLPVYTVFENVEFALILQNVSASERKKRVMEALEWVGLQDLADKKPDKISGGEGQRVAIARAIVKKPDIMLADEPTANLDAKNAHQIMRIMKKLNEELDTTFLFSTHDEKVMKYLERIITLKDGSIAEDKQVTPQKTLK
ncbi:ABC transporter ATP-binding protein [Membranicola marinus]|uniref:ABC transporter ATP-binding protein n=1 Tax=Membranihabitans marinus TaxID=1227546 RepID=A0A953L9V2_9BACT|nr:ABC transporter ATP-binding protein [Membranihabitans marinus]MBY5959220.1 ABC transporter ATP-binding protein [Membranihabitans marinus]